MNFHDLTDACALMGEIAAALGPEAPYYGDFRFFGAVNCTTQSEYRQELKNFLAPLLAGPAPVPAVLRPYAQPLTDLYRWL